VTLSTDTGSASAATAAAGTTSVETASAAGRVSTALCDCQGRAEVLADA
jgi:hypothetical protein